MFLVRSVGSGWLQGPPVLRAIEYNLNDHFEIIVIVDSEVRQRVSVPRAGQAWGMVENSLSETEGSFDNI